MGQDMPVDESAESSLDRPLGMAIPVASGFLVLFLVQLASMTTGTPVSELTRDPLVVADGQFYWGALSNLGVLVWWAGAAVGVFSGLLLRSTVQRRVAGNFLTAIGVFTGIVTLDDLFMVHEHVWSGLTGLSEVYLIMLYGLGLVSILLMFRRDVDFLRHPCFVAAMGFFVLSVVVDRVDEAFFHVPYIIEDGSKFIGQLCWSCFLFQFSHAQILAHWRLKNPPIAVGAADQGHPSGTGQAGAEIAAEPVLSGVRDLDRQRVP